MPESLVPLDPEQRRQNQRLLSDLKKLLAEDSSAEEKLKATVEKLAAERYAAFLAGVERYRSFPISRDLKIPPALWQEGSTHLRDFGGEGEVVLVIPSLVNRYHVLDLDQKQSFLRALKEQGFRPLLVDWDMPGEIERGFTLEAYIGRLSTMLDRATSENKGPVPVIGYCMGGLFAAALAQLYPDKITKLMFLATPWDFHARDEEGARMQRVAEQLLPQLELWQEMPVDMLQSFFILLQPFAVIEKFCRFAGLPEKSPELRAFVLLEDWVNDGVPLAKQVARECLQGWYVGNQPAREKWRVMGEYIRPSTFNLPSLHVVPRHDKIVPPESALALAQAMPGAEIMQPSFGHVSMIAHAGAQTKLWPKLFEWLARDVSRH